MLVASNKLKDTIRFYYEQLKDHYENSEIDAIFAIIAKQVLSFSKTDITLKSNCNINQSDLLIFYKCCSKLKKNIPIQYILENTEFFNLNFFVNKSVLIPRFETEELVKLIISENNLASSFIDIGTGSGCIAIALKKNLPLATIYACDISKEAIVIAKKNAKKNEVDINFFETDVLNTEFLLKTMPLTYDVIISNPPYIKKSEKNSLSKQVIDQEPDLALFVNNDDEIIFYKKIASICKFKLNDGGKLYFELNPLTAELVYDFIKKISLFCSVDLIKDMSGKIRFLRAIKG